MDLTSGNAPAAKVLLEESRRFHGDGRKYDPDNWDAFLEELGVSYESMTITAER